MSETLHLIAYFFGALFFTNAIPHLVAGIMGEPFQSPFAKPPGVGLSSSNVNVLWAFFNIVVGYTLIFHIGLFDIRDTGDAISVGLGILAMSLMGAKSFGNLHGGNLPKA